MDKKIELKQIVEKLAEAYILIYELREKIKDDEDLKKTLYDGKSAYCDARRLQEEFYPLDYDSEEICLTMLEENFKYDGVDYTDELIDDDEKIVYTKACRELGQMFYMLYALRDEILNYDEMICRISNSRIEDDSFEGDEFLNEYI